MNDLGPDNTVHLLVPENLHVDELAPNCKTTRRNLAALVDLIVDRQYMHAVNQGNRKCKTVDILRTPVDLPWRTVQTRCTKHYAEYVNLLRSHHLLDRLPYHEGQCYRYRFTGAVEGKLRPFPATHRSLARKLRSETYDVERDDKHLQRMFKHLSGTHLSPDAFDMMNRLDVSTNRYNYDRKTLTDLSNRRFWFSNRNVCSRVFHNLTSLPREYRPFIRLEGHDELCLLDLSNSNPFMLVQIARSLCGVLRGGGACLRDVIVHVKDDTGNLDEGIDNNGSGGGDGGGGDDIHPFMSNLFSESDFLRFAELCEQGAIYQHLYELAPRYFADVTRETVKRDLLMLMNIDFDNDDHLHATLGMHHLMVDHFPSVLRFILTLKQGNYARLAIAMMRAEANLFVHTIGKTLGCDTDIPFVTIHDCIMTPVSYSDEVKTIMEQAFHREFGLFPPLKVECISS